MSPVDIALLIVILSALVVAHEWGHFIMARLFKIRVDDFSIGFGKRLLRIGKLGDTEYNIRAIPLGGFVKIAGMEPDEEPINRAKDIVTKRAGDSKDSVEGVDEWSKADDDPDDRQVPLLAENMDDPGVYDGPDGFNSKPLWQRSLVILGGPVMSFVTGVAILCLLGCTVGIPLGKSINRVAEVQPGGEGQRIGLRSGDYIVAINDTPVSTGTDMVSVIHNSVGKTLVLTIRRSGQTMKLPAASPKPLMDKNNKPVMQINVVDSAALGAIGLKPGDQIALVNDEDINSVKQFGDTITKNAGHSIKVTVLRGLDPVDLRGTLPATIGTNLPKLNEREIGILNFSPDSAILHMGFKASVNAGWKVTTGIFYTLGQLIKTKQIQTATGGVVSMANMTALARRDGPSHVLSMAAQISISLAIFNMLPIPILDGGHLLAFFIEWIRRGKRMAPQMQNAFMLTGLAIIAVLVVLITGKDIWNAIRHNVPQ